MSVLPREAQDYELRLIHGVALLKQKKKICVMGLGYTGLPTAAMFATHGYEIIGVDVNAEVITAINQGREVFVVKPMNNVNRQLTFQSNLQKLITDQRVLLLVTSISSGSTLKSAQEVLNYYGANLVGVSSLFNAMPDSQEQDINTLFTQDDVSNYRMYKASDCELCKAGRKLDAIIIQGGYTNF